MSEEKIVEPLYFNGYISLDERANIREYIEQLKKDYNRVVHESTEFESKVYELQDKLQQRDEVIEEAIKKCELEISASSLQYERSHKQQDLVYKVAHNRVLDILNKYKKEESE